MTLVKCDTCFEDGWDGHEETWTEYLTSSVMVTTQDQALINELLECGYKPLDDAYKGIEKHAYV